MTRRALVSQTRMPEPDHDRGSQRVDQLIDLLLDDAWSVTFLASEETEGWHAARLRDKGVAAFAGYGHAEEVIAAGHFDLALLAFWEPASRLLPLLREQSPDTRVIIDSIDLHFLRVARRRFGAEGSVDAGFGKGLVGELNTYAAADAVLAVSEKETALLRDLLGSDRIHHLPLVEDITRSDAGPSERSGLLFVGNFRHLPNGEAVEYLCRDVLTRLDGARLAEHPLTVVGNRLDATVRSHGTGLSGVQMVGWVPAIEPYLRRARVCVVPLLHGAGVKGKVIQSLMMGTPVVTTSIGAEGLDLVDGEHAFVADTPADFAGAIDRLLTDDDTWCRMADAGYEHVRASHDVGVAAERFREIVDDTLARESVVHTAPANFQHSRRRATAYRDTIGALRATVEQRTAPGAVVAVVSKGDPAAVDFEGRTGWHFPRAGDGKWAGFHPADSHAAVEHLEMLRTGGATHLVLPSTSFWWLHHYEDLARHLDHDHRRVHADDDVVIVEFRQPGPARTVETVAEGDRAEVLVLGRHQPDRSGPPPALVRALEVSRRFTVRQIWRPAGTDAPPLPRHDDRAEWIVAVDDAAIVPHGFLDDLLTRHHELGAQRSQPAHDQGPTAGPPATERVRGCVARRFASPTALPVLARRIDVAPDGPTTVLDELTVGLARDLPRTDTDAEHRVLDVIVEGPDGPATGVARSELAARHPRLSVLVSTFDRPDLLEACLAGFAEQTADDPFEVVVVDDGSPGSATTDVLARAADRLPLVQVRIAHAGRSAAKNLAAQLARGEVVLFFDDDDRPAPGLVAEHLAAHDQEPDEGTAILGYTGWAPELRVSPLMHYLTDVDRVLFAYGNLTDGQELDWRGFWEGRISCKRALLLRHGLHDQRLDYSIDVEMAWRLAPHGLRVRYRAGAESFMARPITLDDFCRRIEAKGRAQATIARLHPDPDVRTYAKVDGAAERWAACEPGFETEVAATRALESAVAGDDDAPDDDDARLAELHDRYRRIFGGLYDKGVCDIFGAPPAPRVTMPIPTGIGTNGNGRNGQDAAAPSELTVTIPVWSRTPELADMVVRTVDRIWEVARLRTEVIAVDNGSPHARPLRARVHRFDENRGVASAWNTGIALASAPVVAVLNSDCLVEPGWDEALHEAVSNGRRIAFPYTDHGDGQGFRQADQAGTAGWCFMLHTDLYCEIGPFDERFDPAYGEDTDYWHRAWEMGIELTPVPAARVSHARRTTASTDPHFEWLLQAHRYKYGWKHGVDPHRAPPYYNRPIVEYHGTSEVRR
jgi:glycosyltransferase involved in cell wall biosynthesis